MYEADSLRRKRAARHRGGAGKGITRPRILIASSDLRTRKYLARLLSGRWSIATVGSSSGVLESAQTSPPDLVLCAVKAGNEAIQLLRELRARSHTKHLPVMFLSHAHSKLLS